MLKLKPDATFKAKVMVPVAGADPEPVTFEFKHKTRAQLKDWLARPQGESDEQEILGIACGWDLAEPFDAENIGVLVQNYIGAPAAIVATFIDELTKARQGN